MISVLITTYNSSAFISESICSLSHQKFDKFEIIIVDDGSTDNTLEVISTLIKKHSTLDIQCIEAGKIGRAKVLNIGIQAAKFDWIAILDADDLWHPKKLQCQADILLTDNPDVLVTNYKLIASPGEIEFQSLDLNNPITITINYKKAIYNNPICHSSAVIRKSLCTYDESRYSQIDYELWLRLLANNATIILIGETLTYKRLHIDQSFEVNNRVRYILNSFQLRLQHALKTKQIGVPFYILLKAIYYTLIPRRFKRVWKIRHSRNHA